MAIRWYRPVSSSAELELYIDPGLFTEAGDDQTLLDVLELKGLSDGQRAEVGACRGFETLAAYDQQLDDEENEVRDRLDYYAYDTVVKNVTVADGAWFTPIGVQSVCGEETGQEATESIDGDDASFWRHSTDEQHVVIYELRGHPKKISKIRFRYGAAESARERLNNMDVHAARAVANLDDPENILETGINIAWPTGAGLTWVEHTLASKKNKARFIKLVIDDTDNGNNQIQIREFQVWVETRDPLDP